MNIKKKMKREKEKKVKNLTKKKKENENKKRMGNVYCCNVVMLFTKKSDGGKKKEKVKNVKKCEIAGFCVTTKTMKTTFLSLSFLCWRMRD